MTQLNRHTDDPPPRPGNSPAKADGHPTRGAGCHARVVAWLILGISTSWPFGVMGQCTPLTCDTAVDAAIETSSAVDCFTFTARDGEIVDISVVSQDAAGSFQPAWRLIDRSGNDVDAACAGFGTSEPNFACGPLPASRNPYRLEVEADWPGDTGAYGVRFERLTAVDACEDIPLTCGVPVNDTIDGPLDTDLFSFEVDDGEVIEISVVSGLHGGAVIDAAWQLIDGAGNPVDGLCGEFSQSESNYICGPLAAGGNPYRIKVGDDDARDAGQYKVRFQPLTSGAACSSIALECGMALTTAIADPQPDECGFAVCPVLETKLFTFGVNEGEHIAVSVESISPPGGHFLAGWRLLDRTGEPVAGKCGEFGVTSSSFECGPLAAAGNPYQLEVGAAGEAVAGNARVLLNVLTSPCTTGCPGDCDGSGDVTISELLRLVNIALGNSGFLSCSAGDANGDRVIRINELLTAVNDALTGCGGS